MERCIFTLAENWRVPTNRCHRGPLLIFLRPVLIVPKAIESMLPHEVHVWSVRLADCDDPALLDQYEALLSDSERAQWKRFVFERDRHSYLVTRALVRTVLARHVNQAPHTIGFGSGPHGKPYLLNGTGCASHWSFNLSHTHGMVALAVTDGRMVGIDVENIQRNAPLEVASRYFTAMEAGGLQACAPDEQAHRFWSLWTLKECAVKACGRGLTLGLDYFSFRVGRLGEIAVDQQGASDSWAGPWWFGQWYPSDDHIASICVEDKLGRAPTLCFYEAVPMRFERAVPAVFTHVSSTPSGSPTVASSNLWRQESGPSWES